MLPGSINEWVRRLLKMGAFSDKQSMSMPPVSYCRTLSV